MTEVEELKASEHHIMKAGRYDTAEAYESSGSMEKDSSRMVGCSFSHACVCLFLCFFVCCALLLRRLEALARRCDEIRGREESGCECHATPRRSAFVSRWRRETLKSRGRVGQLCALPWHPTHPQGGAE